MGINITQTMSSFQFENKENLRNAARNILNKQGASGEIMQKIVNQTIFEERNQNGYVNPQLSIIKASSQITANNSLKETLKYLRTQTTKKQTKAAILGELWNKLNKDEVEYSGELLNFEIDPSVKNIFVAA